MTMREQQALSTISMDAWFDEDVKSAAQDEDQYRRLVKMKTEARGGLHSAFENHVARIAAKVECLRIVHDTVAKAQQHSLSAQAFKLKLRATNFGRVAGAIWRHVSSVRS